MQQLFGDNCFFLKKFFCKKQVSNCWEVCKNIKGLNLWKKTANYSKSRLSYLNELVDQYNNTYHHSIGKKPILMQLFCFD